MLNNDVGCSAGLGSRRSSNMSSRASRGPLRFDPHGNVDDVPYPYVDGWCLAMLTEDARALGGWDEAYDDAGPAYFSDNALAFQARLPGMRLREVRPGLRHKGGQTGGVDHARFEHGAEGERAAVQGASPRSTGGGVIVVDLGCADRGEWFSLEALADKYRPDRIYGFDPSATLNLRRKRINGIPVTLERKAAWLHDGTITFDDERIFGRAD
jgi:hypothetical protein